MADGGDDTAKDEDHLLSGRDAGPEASRARCGSEEGGAAARWRGRRRWALPAAGGLLAALAIATAAAARRRQSTSLRAGIALARGAQPTLQEELSLRLHSEATKEIKRYKRVLKGSCRAIGWAPISTLTECERAAGSLELRDTSVRLTTKANRPEGCYYFQNTQDDTETLWLSMKEGNKGKGAETSNVAAGGLRQPICKRWISPPAEKATAMTLAVSWKGCFMYTGPDEDSFLEDMSGPHKRSIDTQACAHLCELYSNMVIHGRGECVCLDHLPPVERYKRVEDEKCLAVCKGEEKLEPKRLCGGPATFATYGLAASA